MTSLRLPVRHYLFGYGSIICPYSRAVTAPTLAKEKATPVLVKNVERTWTKRSVEFGMTAMGVRFQTDAACAGVLLPVNGEELGKFDVREKGYDRVPIEMEEIEIAPFLDDSYYQDKEHRFFMEAKERNNVPQSMHIWVYVPQIDRTPREDYPIVQSYVDTILRGCLTISEDFAKSFIRTTKGWKVQELLDEDLADDESDGNDEHEPGVYWVNDRHNPIYPRGDQSYMLKNGLILDKLLRKHRPDEFCYRKQPRL